MSNPKEKLLELKSEHCDLILDLTYAEQKAFRDNDSINKLKKAEEKIVEFENNLYR
jgi:hypothetical protein